MLTCFLALLFVFPGLCLWFFSGVSPARNDEGIFLVPRHLKGKIIWVRAKRGEKTEQMLFVGFRRFQSGLVLAKLNSRRGRSCYFPLTDIVPIKGQVNPLLSLVPKEKEEERRASKKSAGR